jgi:hypothetical protein
MAAFFYVLIIYIIKIISYTLWHEEQRSIPVVVILR